MKKIIIPISALFVAGLYSGQTTAPSTAENYIYSKTYLDYDGNNQPVKSSETIQYFDGLGRPSQVINVKATPTNKDLVTTIPYDGFGRQVDSWLPVPMPTMNGAIQSGVDGAAQTYYNDSNPFVHKNLESSPLSRVISQVQPGLDWQGHPIQLNYEVNADEEVKKYTATFDYGSFESTITLSQTGYLANQLYKNTVTDEDGNATIEFKNKDGQVVLVRKVISATENADTYYVYNEYNQLAYVIPPLASLSGNVDPSTLDMFCYQYKYDERNRLIEKKLPGKGWEYMVYDRQGRLILSQDANMRTATNTFNAMGWLFNKYDQFGRILYTGFFSSTLNRAALQNEVNNIISNTENIELRSTNPFTLNGIDVYYTKNAFPTVNMTILTVNYFDKYPPGAPTIQATIQGQGVISDLPNLGVTTKNLPLASYVKNIEDDNWTKNYIWYDKRGRAIANYSFNHLGGYTKTESLLDFAGVVQKTDTKHLRKQGETGVFVSERFIYDNQNRLLQHYHQVDDKPEILLTDNTYNELSQLSNRQVGNNLQSIDYTYNIRGWLTDINKNQMSVPDLGNKLFSYKIKYTQKEGIDNPDTVQFPGKNVSVRYNGNIAEVDWRAVETIGVNPSSTPKRYGYVYDGLNRLTAGYYQNPLNPTSKENTESLSYDLNGNISSLYRTSTVEYGNTAPTVIDNLQYTYGSGNRLTQIDDTSGNPTGYEAFPSPFSNIINYDANGNMTSMPGKRISAIQYNFLNLPNQTQIDMDFPFTMTQLYRADGLKLKKTTVSTIAGYNTITTTTENVDYLDGFQYKHTDTVTNGGDPGGGGGGEAGAMVAPPETSRAMEMQAYSLDDGSTTKNVLGVKTADLQFFPTAEGFYDYIKSQYIYQYKDHLGNVRISFGRNSLGNLELVDNNDYYPFGMNHLKSGISFFGASSYKNYKYNGKELQETGMYDYGARFYMPDIGRWGVQDPLSEKFFDFSNYNYVLNNPVKFVDKDGMDVYLLNEDGKFILAKRQEGDDLVYGYNSKTGKINDNNGDKKGDYKDGIRIKTKGLIGQLTGYRKGAPYRMYQAVADNTKQHEEDLLNLFHYSANNAPNVEFSLIYFDNKGKDWISFQTYGKGYGASKSPGYYDIGIEPEQLQKIYHNHPGNDSYDESFTERNSMGEKVVGERTYVSGDYDNVRNNNYNSPYYVYFPKSTNLYNVTKKGIYMIQKINNDAKKLKK